MAVGHHGDEGSDGRRGRGGGQSAFIQGVKLPTALVDPHNEDATLSGGRLRRERRECRPGPLSCSSDVVPPINKDKDKKLTLHIFFLTFTAESVRITLINYKLNWK